MPPSLLVQSLAGKVEHVSVPPASAVPLSVGASDVDKLGGVALAIAGKAHRTLSL